MSGRSGKRDFSYLYGRMEGGAFVGLSFLGELSALLAASQGPAIRLDGEEGVYAAG